MVYYKISVKRSRLESLYQNPPLSTSDIATCFTSENLSHVSACLSPGGNSATISFYMKSGCEVEFVINQQAVSFFGLNSASVFMDFPEWFISLPCNALDSTSITTEVELLKKFINDCTEEC